MKSTVETLSPTRVRLAIEAPDAVRVDREEVRERLNRCGFIDAPAAPADAPLPTCPR